MIQTAKIFNIKNFLLITIFIFAVFPTMSFAVGTRTMPVGLLFAIVVFVCMFIKPKKIFKNFQTLQKLLSTKILICFGIWAVISAIFVSVFMHISIIKMLFSIFLALILSFLLPYFLSFMLTKNFDTKFLIKFYTIILYTILFFGIIDFGIYYFSIHPLDDLYVKIIANARYLKGGEAYLPLFLYTKSGILPRVQSVFEEPSHFAWFICINIPIILNLCLSKYKIFKNKYLNLIIKGSMIPLMYIVLAMTQSPLNIIFAIIITVLYFSTKIKLKSKQILKILFLLLVSILAVLYIGHSVMNATPDDRFFYRIKMVVMYTRSFYDLVSMEASLATRLDYYAMMFNIFEKYPFFGCGWGNLGQYLYHEVQTTGLPLTEEIFVKYLKSAPEDFGYCVSIFFRTIAETGVIGIALLFAFFVKIQQYTKYLKEKSAFIVKDFYSGIEQAILLYIILSFYDSNIYIEYFWILFGTIAGLLSIHKQRKVACYEYKNDV